MRKAADEGLNHCLQSTAFPKGVGLLHSYEQRKVSVKSHSAKVWLSQDFPVSLEDLLPIFAILSPNGKHFEKLKEFLAIPLPENGFPVKIGEFTSHPWQRFS